MKTRMVIVTMVIMSLFAISAFAQGMGGGNGQGWGGRMGNGGMMGNGGGMWPGNGVGAQNESEAKAIVQSIIDANFSGYTINEVVKVNNDYNGHQMYFVYVSDNSGNPFTFMTGQYGGVRGPIPGKLTTPWNGNQGF